MRRLAVVIGFGGLLLAIGTVVWACIPPPPPPETVVIVPAAPVKSLVLWWELEANYAHNAPYHFTNKIAPQPPVRAYYVGSVSHRNLVARCNTLTRKGTDWTEWGPAVREEGYVVTWRGLGEIHVELQGWSLEQAKADLERCEGRAVTVSEMPHSSRQP